MTENKRYSFNWESGHPNFWDNHCDLADCYLTYDDVVNRLNELAEENTRLKEENQELIGLIQEDVESWSDEKKQALCDMSNAILGDFV